MIQCCCEQHTYPGGRCIQCPVHGCHPPPVTSSELVTQKPGLYRSYGQLVRRFGFVILVWLGVLYLVQAGLRVLWAW